MKYLFAFLTSVLFVAGCAGSRSINNYSQFTPEQIKLINSADSLRPMSILNIYNYADSILLRSKSRYVIPDSNDAILQKLIKGMYITVTDSITGGVGIAAPQVGILKNIIWVQRFDKSGSPFEVYLNPEIIQYTKKELNWVEGCLSIPGRRDTTTRSYAILLEYQKPDNSRKSEMVEGFTAIIFQHEIDHLNGIVYLDRLSSGQRNP